MSANRVEMTRRHPPCRSLGAPETIRVGWPAVFFRIQYSGAFLFLQSSLTLACGAILALFGTPHSTSDSIIADHSAQLSEPKARPGKFNAQDRKPQRDDNDGGTRCDNHDYPEQDYGSADDRYGDTASRFVR
jgi:hypothetical protein